MVSTGKVVIIVLSSALVAMGSFFAGYLVGADDDDDTVSDEQSKVDSADGAEQRERADAGSHQRNAMPLRGYALYTAICRSRVDECNQKLEDVQHWCNPYCEEELARCKSETEEYRLTQLDFQPRSLPMWAHEYPRHFGIIP